MLPSTLFDNNCVPDEDDDGVEVGALKEVTASGSTLVQSVS